MVHELRLVVAAEDYDDALRFYRDVLGLEERESYSSPDVAFEVEPTRTPWSSLNARLRAPAGLQLTLFQERA